MEELEALDEKAIEQEYIDSYHYTTTQKVVGSLMAFGFICAIIALCCVVFMRIIGYFIG